MLFLCLVLVTAWMRSMIITWISFDIITISTTAGAERCVCLSSLLKTTKHSRTLHLYDYLSQDRSVRLYQWTSPFRGSSLVIQDRSSVSYSPLVAMTTTSYLPWYLVISASCYSNKINNSLHCLICVNKDCFNGVSRECEPPVKNVFFGSCPTLISVGQLLWWSKRYMPEDLM